ncbi:hypothetical protein A0H81_07203 [Grifola frondosa]|uniref:Uncharacterized protein n=1 Tax=Grifola frondosa TaxID=5627 RepID=A0A1C7M832_GRIFR|nr:hypothetical protein A0H81_07203 [Grifola frondosa]
MLPLSALSTRIAPDSTWHTVPNAFSSPATPTSATETANPPTPVSAPAGELTAAATVNTSLRTGVQDDAGACRVRSARGRKAKPSPQSTAGMPELWPNSAVTARNIYGGEWRAQNPGGSKDQFDVHWKGLSATQQDAYKARARDLKKSAAVVTPPNVSAMATTSTPQDGGSSVPAAS